ncbi:MAG: Dipeptidyl-peptidase 5 [Chlamydiae bacterium]|nr:Dipeptidyl-peptidase 5 [Chlamydiota bacterium]
MDKFETRNWVEFTNKGEKIVGVIHRPLNIEKPPVVLFCHGLAGHKIGQHRMYVLLSECLSKAGIASYRFDFRGSGDSEGNFGEMSLEGEVSDAVKAFAFLSQQPHIDPNRIGVFGRSFGCAIAVIAAHRFGNVKSMGLWAPVYNAEQWEEHWEMIETQQVDEEQRHELMRINGQLPSMDFYKELFAMSIEKELESLKEVPLLVIHGEKDPFVSIKHAEQYVEARKSAPATTEFIRLPHSDHDFTHPEEKLKATHGTCEWFAKTL